MQILNLFGPQCGGWHSNLAKSEASYVQEGNAYYCTGGIVRTDNVSIVF